MLRKVGLVAGLVLFACLVPGAAQVADEFDEYGGRVGVRRAATGFFRTTRGEGRWWLVDPSGSVFISVGVNRVSLRPRDPRKEKGSPYREASLEKYRTEGEWSRAVVERLRGWGFNTLGAGSDRATWGREMPYTVSLKCTSAAPLGEGREFPDVYDPAYERAVRRHASRVCRSQASDRWLVGYFTDDEVRWGSAEQGAGSLLAEFLGLGDEAPGRRALLRFLALQHLNIGELNEVWGTEYASFEEVGRTPQVGSRIPREDVAAFQREVAERYFQVAHDAIRAADEYHLILGPQFGEEVPGAVLQAMDEYVDVVSLKCQGTTPPVEQVREIYRATQLPVLISRFGFRAAGPSGVAEGEEAAGAAREERVELYEEFVHELLALPMVVGYHWVDHADEAVRDRRGGYVGGFGLVNVRDEPYGPLVAAARRVNGDVYRPATGKAPNPSGAEDGG